MRVLQVHNFYQQPGGEDQVFRAECELLRRHGNEVEQYSVHNDAIRDRSGLRAGLETVWNRKSYREVAKMLARFRPNVMHCHNTFPVASPAVYYAAARAKVPVVQTLHNYRLVCPAATFLRDGHVCEDCLRRFIPYPAVVYGCYRGNRMASTALASMLAVHRTAGTWRNKVHTYVALTEFLRTKLAEGGLPAEKITVKPNFLLNDPGPGAGDGGYALFAGRLAAEKGLDTLLNAWEGLPRVPLKIAGDGPLRERVAEKAKSLLHVSVLGPLPAHELLEYMQRAALLVVPSEWYEGFPMAVVEAMACGTPVVASDLGSLREIVEEGVIGARFIAGNAGELAGVIRRLFASPESLHAMRGRVRQRFLERYSAEVNYLQLQAIYRACSRSF